MTKLIPIFFIATGLTAQPWSGIVDPARAVDWSTAGTTPATRTTVCSSLTTSNTLTQINNAIAACGDGEVVEFAAGTYNLSGGIVVSGKDNITLRGAGPDQTIFVFTGSNSCGGLGGAVCVRATTLNDLDSPGNTANWTANYAKGTSTITLSSVTNLQVGSILMLDQLNDSSTDDNEIWICRVVNVCCTDCATPSRNSGGLRSQVQAVRVTAINGNDVTISPPIIWPNFGTSGKDPEGWWSSGKAITGVGIENLTINTESATGADSSIFMFNVIDSWVKNVAILHCRDKCIRLYQSIGIDISNSYFYDKFGADSSQEGSESYGVDAYLATSWRITNTIAHHITSPFQCESGVGGVIAYNYSFDDFYNETNPDWAQASSYTHGTCAYILHESNSGFGMIQDNVHAPNYFHTAFRNRFVGWETGYSLQTVPIHVYAPNRYVNVVGNVLGTNSYHTKYESYPGSATDCDTSIYALGFGGNCGNASIANKADVRTSSFRWGNYDTVNDATRFVSGEVPTTDANYPNSEPGSQTLPASFFLSEKPTNWWATPWGEPAWPAIGPDVTGGQEANIGGHAHKLPAQLCYENSSKTGVQLSSFNASSCYQASLSGTGGRGGGAVKTGGNSKSGDE